MKSINKKIYGLIIACCICISLLFFVVVVKAVEQSNINLIGKTIYLDAGHGGKDNGASFNGVLEDEINLKITGFIMENLIDLGAYVLTSRTSDYDLSDIYDANKKRHDLINRVNRINSSKTDLFISIHLNSYSSSNIRGAQVFHQNNENSILLADTIQKNLNILSTSKDRKIKKGDYYILNKTDRTGVIVECGFLSNTEERELLVNELYQQKIAKKITKGIVEYFNN